MEYKNILPAVFISRPNRFIANVELDGVPTVCHVKNTGRCKELLVPGAKVFIEDCRGRGRKTDFDLISVIKNGRLINMDSIAPNKVFGEFAASGGFMDGVTLIKPEFRHGSSRFDFYMESGGRRILTEVKGVTLENGSVVSFPDAPTERGVKHLRELAASIGEGFEAHVVFVVQMSGVKYLHPNWDTHPEFGNALCEAASLGVHIHAYECAVKETSLNITTPVPVVLKR